MAETVPVSIDVVRQTLDLLAPLIYQPCSTDACTGTAGIDAIVSDDGIIGFCVTCPCGASSTDFHPVFQAPGIADAVDAAAAREAGVPVPDPFPDEGCTEIGVEIITEPVRWLVTSLAPADVMGQTSGPDGDWQPFAVEPAYGRGPRVWFRRPQWSVEDAS
jgi:hypothetical protein